MSNGYQPVDDDVPVDDLDMPTVQDEIEDYSFNCLFGTLPKLIRLGDMEMGTPVICPRAREGEL